MPSCSPVTLIADVPILRTGLRYELASGPRTFTQADLQGALDALRDPHVREPRLGLGHIDERFAPEHDGEPAFGRAVNMRLAESGNAIVADLEVGPEWLTDEVVASAFPARSIEARVDWESPGGQTWPLVITAVKLLGTIWPGISTLDDLQQRAVADRSVRPRVVGAVRRRTRSPVDGGLLDPIPPEEENMTLIERLRSELGLPEDADEDAVFEAWQQSRTAEPEVLRDPGDPRRAGDPVAEQPEPVGRLRHGDHGRGHLRGAAGLRPPSGVPRTSARSARTATGCSPPPSPRAASAVAARALPARLRCRPGGDADVDRLPGHGPGAGR